jgi:hypothetical protein
VRKTVYFIQAGHIPRVKIGESATDKIIQHLCSINTYCPYEIKILTTVNGITENQMHELFADYRLKGEWFYLSLPLRQFIERVAKLNGDKQGLADTITDTIQLISQDPIAENLRGKYARHCERRGYIRAQKTKLTLKLKRERRE